ncbi:DUF342 domain-containing protein [Ectothiorhodospiraceae bacterium BW-2]|nr:DUF342 domain-containing protein [Ectothiorhodospiraceae bacterium BW-2]
MAAAAGGALRRRPLILQLGLLAKKERLMTDVQLKALLNKAKQLHANREPISLRQLLIEDGLLSQEQFDQIVALHKMRTVRQLDRRFGQLAVGRGWLTELQVSEALARQRAQFNQRHKAELIGHILVAQGALRPEQRDEILVEQQRLDRVRPESEKGGEPEEGGVELTFELKTDRLGEQCELVLFKPDRAEDGLSRLKAMLKKARVIYGLLDDEHLQRLLRGEEGESGTFVIAVSTPPIEGRAGYIEYLFDTDPLRVGTIKEGGQIDYRDRGELPMVEPGERLAQLHAAVAGRAGKNIFGKAITPAKLKTPKLNIGKGVRLSDDRMGVEALLHGAPAVTSTGAIFVFDVHKIQGDIDYSSGHVIYDGDIQVGGAVREGFKVKGGKLTAKEVWQAEIEIVGDVLVQGGIIGAKIRCGGHLRAHFILNADIEASGDIVVDREVIHSVVHCGGSFIGERVTLLNSHLSSCGDITLKQAGSEEGGSPNQIEFGTCYKLQRDIESRQQQLEALKAQRQQHREQCELLTQERRQINDTITAVAQRQDSARVEQQRLTIQRQQLGNQQSMEARRLTQRLEALQQQINRAEAELEAIFSRLDAIEVERGQRQQQALSLESDANFIDGELEVLLEQQQQQGGGATLRVVATLYRDNVVVGVYSRMRLKSDLSRVLLKQQRVANDEGGYEWRIGYETVTQLSPTKS